LTDNQYHAGWAWAGSTPYKGTKLLASHFGGHREKAPFKFNGTINNVNVKYIPQPTK
jgi:arylsulfatase